MQKLVITLLILFWGSFSTQAAENQGERYKTSNGVLQGPTETPPPVTLMVDSWTGRSWVLIVTSEKAMKWVPIPFMLDGNDNYVPSISP